MQNQKQTALDSKQCFQRKKNKDLLRFIVCGSVDDGKSTLIGRLLYEAHGIYDDQLAALEKESKRFGTVGEGLDFALLLDGLTAEREQGITIDVAHRFFSTKERKFVVVDAPGHEQYTRNMATGASLAKVAVVLIDARKGVLEQTRRHTFIASLFGIKHFVLAINKMDLVRYKQQVFDTIKEDYCNFLGTLPSLNCEIIPLSALTGENVVMRNVHMRWYKGPTLLTYLEQVEVDITLAQAPFRMSVQWVNRPHSDFRGFSGQIASGSVAVGDKIKILPAGKETEVKRLVTYDGDLPEAIKGQAVTCVLSDEIDISRGDVFSSVLAPLEVAKQFETNILWLSEEPMVGGRQYLAKIGAAKVLCSIAKLKYQINVNTMERLAVKTLALNAIGCCEISLDRPIPFESYEKNQTLGSFILIDRKTNNTVAAGLIHFALRRSTNIHVQNLLVDRHMRAALKEQKPCVLWLTGLSGAGKSTLANLVEYELSTLGKHTMILDGDNLRHGLNRDLGFSEGDRAENIRRVAEVAKLMLEAGLIVLVSFISPFAAEREMARHVIGKEQFLEIFVDASLEVVQARDVKGLYEKAIRGEIKNFTGIGSPYEPPQAPDLRVDTEKLTERESAEKIINFLKLWTSEKIEVGL